jgi:hypothetical protein
MQNRFAKPEISRSADEATGVQTDIRGDNQSSQHTVKGKPVARRGRNATGLFQEVSRVAEMCRPGDAAHNSQEFITSCFT